MDETTVPVLPCLSLDETIEFYALLGFKVTYKQKSPYIWLALQRDDCNLHFFGIKTLVPQEAFSTCLIMVNEVATYHRTFAEALRAKYGKVPIAGIPRITRFKMGQSRFTLVDPSGNSLLYIQRGAPDIDHNQPKAKQQGLADAIQLALQLRDSKNDDEAAARILDVALSRHETAPPIERARALAARAEIAVAQQDTARLQAIQTDFAQINLTEAERANFRQELEAATELEKWLKLEPESPSTDN